MLGTRALAPGSMATHCAGATHPAGWVPRSQYGSQTPSSGSPRATHRWAAAHWEPEAAGSHAEGHVPPPAGAQASSVLPLVVATAQVPVPHATDGERGSHGSGVATHAPFWQEAHEGQSPESRQDPGVQTALATLSSVAQAGPAESIQLQASPEGRQYCTRSTHAVTGGSVEIMHAWPEGQTDGPHGSHGRRHTP